MNVQQAAAKRRAAVHAGPPARLNESACDFALLTVRTISECFYYSRPVSARALNLNADAAGGKKTLRRAGGESFVDGVTGP